MKSEHIRCEGKCYNCKCFKYKFNHTDFQGTNINHSGSKKLIKNKGRGRYDKTYSIHNCDENGIPFNLSKDDD